MWTCSNKNKSCTRRTGKNLSSKSTIKQSEGLWFFYKVPTLHNSTWCTFLSCFADAKPFTKWKTLTTWGPWECSPWIYWCLKIDNFTPFDTVLFPHQPENCARSDHLPLNSPPHPPRPNTCLLKCLPETHQGVWVFWAFAALDSLSDACGVIK